MLMTSCGLTGIHWFVLRAVRRFLMLEVATEMSSVDGRGEDLTHLIRFSRMESSSVGTGMTMAGVRRCQDSDCVRRTGWGRALEVTCLDPRGRGEVRNTGMKKK
jgi:hypothetical protein